MELLENYCAKGGLAFLPNPLKRMGIRARLLMSDAEKKVVAKLSQEELEDAVSLQAELDAVKELFEALFNEQTEVMRKVRAYWVSLTNKYGIDVDRYSYYIDYSSGALVQGAEKPADNEVKTNTVVVEGCGQQQEMVAEALRHAAACLNQTVRKLGGDDT